MGSGPTQPLSREREREGPTKWEGEGLSPPPIGRTNPFAKQLRRHATDAEKLLWRRLRDRQIAGAKFRRQATVGAFIVDFLCVEARLIIEVDGGQHNAGADLERTAWLNERGFELIRFWNHDVIENIDGVCEAICLVLEGKIPSPNPLPLAGEGSS